MSRESHGTRANSLAELAAQLRQLQAHGASFFRAAAARTGMTVNDLQVIDILDSADPLTAGQLADLTGLTTGAITGMLNRLEESGLVQRERDPSDGRRIIVRLNIDTDAMREIRAIFDTIGKAWEEMATRYDEEQITFLLDFLQRSNALAQQEIIRLREAPSGAENVHSTPMSDLASGRLIASGVAALTVRADATMDTLYQARFEGPAPEVKARDGAVTMRYPRRLTWLPGVGNRSADVTLNGSIPWRIMVQGGGSAIVAELDGLDLAGLEVKGGASIIRLDLPAPSTEVPIQITGAASDIRIQRPTGVAARVHLKGWASAFVFDEQRFSYLGNDVRLQSPGYDDATARYDIEIAASVSTATITTRAAT